MRTRNSSKRQFQSSDEQSGIQVNGESGSGSQIGSKNVAGALADKSRAGVDKRLRRSKKNGAPGKKKENDRVKQRDSISMTESGSERNEEQGVAHVDTVSKMDPSKNEDCSTAAAISSHGEVNVGSVQDVSVDDWEDDEVEWEDGSTPQYNSTDNGPNDQMKGGFTIEFDEPESAKKKPVRRFSAEDKELAELVHRAHLLCLLARGRLIDTACDDPLIQASLLSLLPAHLLKISGVSKLTASALSPIVSWIHNNFRIRNTVGGKKSFSSALAFALETHEGTPEEIAALSVALFRALGLTTRFVSILDVAPLKPGAENYASPSQDGGKAGAGIFSTSTLMVAKPKASGSRPPVRSIQFKEEHNIHETSPGGSRSSKSGNKAVNSSKSEGFTVIDESSNRALPSEGQSDSSGVGTSKSQALKRKGDLEFELQMEMALAATAVGSNEGNNIKEDVKILNGNYSSDVSSPFKRVKRIQSVESQGVSTAIGSRKVGSPLFWAEVFCSGENMSGKWVHVDVVNAIIDGEEKVEAAAAACKTSLRYVVAFAGRGAKDVTRRYCMKWYKIAPKRVNSTWWDSVLAPLKELESGATGGIGNHDTQPNPEPSKENSGAVQVESSPQISHVVTRNSLEDMEMETRALTEPLPTNQQAYKNHQLYALERWLNRTQILHPKGPILGYCSGQPVYPRTCVQTLKPKERWLREGLQIKANEIPAKIIKCAAKLKKVEVREDDDCDDPTKGTIELYGKWQLEPLFLPRAVNGIVPKNERGQVDVWSEKCLPPGTVHLRFPRIFAVAKRLEIDYAPAMVGFDFRNGRAIPVYEGIVVCTEFKDAILEAYAEEDERRKAEEKKRDEAQAASRWYQLLSSIITRQKLNNRYGPGASSSSSIPNNNPEAYNNANTPTISNQEEKKTPSSRKDDKANFRSNLGLAEEHQHVYLTEDQSFNEESSVRTKRCRCGFSIQVEEI